MDNSTKIKEMVRDKYAEIARKANSCACGCSDTDYSDLSKDYNKLDGYMAEADLALGCGIPTQYAGIKSGDTVIDLGSGAGNDVFVARSLCGEKGKVYGIDMTTEMIEKANENLDKLGFSNIEFKLGEIEHIPLENQIADVVISNCVLNLVDDKSAAFDEIFRILKTGGHFCISDIVTNGKLPDSFKRSAELYAGCISGAMDETEYLDVIKKSGFSDVEIKIKEKIVLPDEVLRENLSEDDIKSYRALGTGIFSITVLGYK